MNLKDMRGSDRGLIEVLSQYLLEGLRKATKESDGRADVQGEARAQHLPNARQKSYCMAKLHGVISYKTTI
jgi:hypothetical protein